MIVEQLSIYLIMKDTSEKFVAGMVAEIITPTRIVPTIMKGREKKIKERKKNKKLKEKTKETASKIQCESFANFTELLEKKTVEKNELKVKLAEELIQNEKQKSDLCQKIKHYQQLEQEQKAQIEQLPPKPPNK